MADIDFRALFDALPSPHMVLDRDLRYVHANPAYVAATGRALHELVGQGLFDLFPNADESGRKLRTSLDTVLATGRMDTIPLIHYAIPRPGVPGVFDDRYWSAAHLPLKDAADVVRFVVQNTVDVTELTRSRASVAGVFQPGEVDLLQRVQEVERAQARVEAESEDFRRLFTQAPSAIAILHGPDHVFTFANDAYIRLVGGRDVLGKPVRTALPEVVEQGFVDLLNGVLDDGEQVLMRGARVMLAAEDGEAREVFLDFTYQAVRGPDGDFTGVFVQALDVSESVRNAARQRLLLDELNHRVKNTLSTVQAIAGQTLRSAESAEAFRDSFEARLKALSRAHDLLVRSQWEGADLAAILRDELRPHGEDRVTLTGPPIFLPSREALALSLVVHELATNAAKYGGLSTAEGRLTVEWLVVEEAGGPRLRLNWSENGGPPVPGAPERRGFGSRLIERSVTRDLQGRIDAAFDPHGVSWTLDMPVPTGEGA